MGKKGGGRVRVKQVGPKISPNTNPLADLAIPPEEVIHLPLKPDSNSGFLFWPISETLTMPYKKFSAIYPNYIDSEKTYKMGRRIAIQHAVSMPTIYEIHDALIKLNIPHVIQPYKGYSRDAYCRWTNTGRVLIDPQRAAERMLLAIGENEECDTDDMIIPEMNDEVEDSRSSRGSALVKKRLLQQLARIIREVPNRENRIVADQTLNKNEGQPQLVTPMKVTAGGTCRKKKGKKTSK